MSEKEKQLLIKNIFLSEISYKIIEDRLQTETNLDVIADYKKKLRHDKEVLNIWVNKLKKEGVDIYSSKYQNVRQQVLDEVIQRKQQEVKEVDDTLASLAKEKVSISQEDKDNYTEQKSKLNNLISKISELKQEETKWKALKSISLQ